MNSLGVISLKVNTENTGWTSLSYKEKNRQLFLHQKKTLDTFLEHGAISQAQHDKSLHDLIEKMGFADNEDGTMPTYTKGGV